jgi:ankyrin repeat protein
MLRSAIEKDVSIEAIRELVGAATTEATRSWCLVHVAGRRGNLAALKILLELGADPNLLNTAGESPLWSTLLGLEDSGGRGEENVRLAVQALIDSGADVNRANPQGVTPLHGAAAVGNVTLLKQLIVAGATVDSVAKGNVTPLVAAARNGHISAARTLLEHGANVNVRFEEGHTLIQLCKNHNLSLMVNLLRTHGASE